MGYCNGDCEYLTTRHNCKKYKKGLTYSKVSSRSISTGAVHERCSECDKDHRIAELEEQINQQWIPVEERLPEGGEEVQVTVRRGWVDIGYYDESREEWWASDDSGLMDVIAWKPMSEPYRPAE